MEVVFIAACLLRRKRKILHRYLLRSNSNGGSLLAQYFMIRYHSICSRRQSFDLKMPVRSADSKKRVLYHIDKRLHPRMVIAAYRHHQLWLAENARFWLAIRRL